MGKVRERFGNAKPHFPSVLVVEKFGIWRACRFSRKYEEIIGNFSKNQTFLLIFLVGKHRLPANSGGSESLEFGDHVDFQAKNR